MRSRGHGTISRTERRMGVPPDTLRGSKNSRNGLRLRHVTEAIEAMGIPPSVFFNDAIGGISSTAAERFMARGAELAARKLVEEHDLDPAKIEVVQVQGDWTGKAVDVYLDKIVLMPPTPAMPFWALILLVVLIAAVGYLMTRKS